MSKAVVEQAKKDLQAAGVDLSGPCGAFAITNLTASRLKLGTVYKPAGNNCRERSVDGVMDKTGRFWDVLIDAGGANDPAFNPGDPIESSRYRDPEPVTLPPPPPPPVIGKPLTDWLATAAMIARLYQEELGRGLNDADIQGEANWLYHWREWGRDEAWIRARIRESPEWTQKHP